MLWYIKGSRGLWGVGVRSVTNLACLFSVYLCYTETDKLQECTTQTLFKDSLTIR